ncbi:MULTISPECIES: ATP-dependent nuclease [Enterococcus]|uniref:ATP-dependent nuclease n=1 Tax=Enterococcus TaxID=1350 RepID=UPI0010F437AD|nr:MULTISPECIES: AAA family ATPase [Enterococcus]MDT2447475.1 AAA family ATPase [Enterococcus avium]
MKIKSVRIKNFRALKDVQIEFEDITTFIGPNGAGKSSIMYALDWFFNAYGKNNNLSDDDCNCNNGNEISVEVIFNCLTEYDKEVLGAYVTDIEENLVIIKTRGSGGEERLSANSMGYRPFTEIKESKTAKEKKDTFNRLIETDENLSTIQKATSKVDAETKMREFENAHRNLLSKVPSHLSTDFFGFNGQGVMNNNFSFIFISANLRANEEANDDNKSSVISRIIESTIDRKEADDKVNELYTTITENQRQVYNEVYGQFLKEISNNMNEVISHYTLNKKVIVTPKMPSITPPKARFDISVVDFMDENNQYSVDRQGHGFQRTLIISALQYLAEYGRGSDNNATICLAIEEPELYQHPIQTRIFNSALRKIISDNPEKTQVMFATHSSIFIETKEVHKIRKVSCVESGSGSEIKSFSLSDLQDSLKEYVKESTINNQIKNILSNSLSEAVFSDKAILLEGTTDHACVKGVVDSFFGSNYFERLGINYVVCGSKTNIILYAQILKFFGIKTYAIFDGDYTKNKDGKNQENNAKLNGNITEYFSGVRIENPKSTICDLYTSYEENLEEELRKFIPDFDVKYQVLCDRAEIYTSKNSDIYYEMLKNQSFQNSFFEEMINSIRMCLNG